MYGCGWIGVINYMNDNYFFGIGNGLVLGMWEDGVVDYC